MCRRKHFASARNTVHVHRRLQRIGIQSYYRRHRQLETYWLTSICNLTPRTLSISLQTHSRTRRHAFVDTSTLSTLMYASANACLYAQQCSDASMNASAKVSVCVHGSPGREAVKWLLVVSYNRIFFTVVVVTHFRKLISLFMISVAVCCRKPSVSCLLVEWTSLSAAWRL